MKDEDLVFQNSDSIFREEDEGAFLFDPETGNLKFINEMGVHIYKMCRGEMTPRDIVDVVSEEYAEIPEEQIYEDVTSFLRELLEMKFLLTRPELSYGN